jgi:hypothetical protein
VVPLFYCILILDGKEKKKLRDTFVEQFDPCGECIVCTSG